MTDLPLAEERVKRTDPDRKWKIARDCLLEGVLYLSVFLITAILFFILKPFIDVYRVGAVARGFIALVLGGCGAFIAYMGITKRLKTRHIAIIILVIGYAIRVGYMLYTPAATRQHDMYSKNHNGHEAYAWTIFETGKLPTHNDYQFYHPPLNAMIQAAFMHIVEGVTSIFGGTWFPDAFIYGKPNYIADNQRYFLYSSCQILSVLYSFITAVTLMKILKMFSFSKKTYLFLSAFVVLFPRHIQFAAMLNNDALSYMMAVLALYFALRWWKGRKSLIYILLCGLAIGLGMMAKLSSATVCIPIAAIFIYEFIATLGKKRGALPFWEMVCQYGLFLCICAPIGLWFQVYANIRFDQSLGFVFSKLNKKLYTGDHDIWERFGITLDMNEYFLSLYCRPFDSENVPGNYNLLNYLTKSSIFGEFSYKQGESFGAVALVFAYMGMVFLVFGAVWSALLWRKYRKKTKNSFCNDAIVSSKDLMFIIFLVASQVLAEIYFYIQMPYGCTMDFRYIMPLILGLALSIGVINKILVTAGGTWAHRFSAMLSVLAGGLIVSSTLFYCICG